MILSHYRPEFTFLIIAVLLWGCGSSPAAPSSTQVPGPASPTASPAGTTATPAAVSPAATTPSGGPIGPGVADGDANEDSDPPGLDLDPLLNGVVVTVSDGLRVRSEPRVSDDSIKYEPLLPLGTELTVLDGPVSASGYTWYQVEPVSFVGLDGPGYGWVAMAGTDGEPWIDTLRTPPVALVSGDQRAFGVTECGWPLGDNCLVTIYALGVESIVRIPIGGVLRFELPIGCGFAKWSIGWVSQREHERWRGMWPDTFEVVEAGDARQDQILELAAPPAGDWSVRLRWGADCDESDGPHSYGWIRDRFRVVVGD